MDVTLLIIQAVLFIFPAYCANATPVLAGGGTKIDFGKNFIDGKRLFGNNKTFRGFFFGWLVGLSVGLVECYFVPANIFSLPILFAVLTPFGALLGDLTAAFLKRRLDIAPGGLFPIVDQIDFVIGAIIFSLPLLLIDWKIAVTILLITPPIHLFTNFCAYKLKLKKHPW
ncbi:MAG: CDP-2,3-bis-(O-geranylgeranyl)-sn-glycerol synthase [Nitrososphaerota archaeon]|uniref:CDP-2,3-bis-(O-geranylgeranyl)-sn-glycerol synthase n=1 Tax=Candidatus Bathycorpusculum sp. TaxID=2994959 RepID=UPI002825957A|nr:CDP-2,3-bis-(O-geranylgeranyl)-sn-glycerol synthase [Candidatus Termiticorpusculum sp.]MCL2257988.1 CDP-2,3-bis-(O-geranylgeranyl)-sn-glycerol synthase [Candidatus Termiticorpusculum sp.]MCL2291821.1 CDP-2,3-bis-(O-geranylgeranyl)-sn-glycerol synthase [Candidatus Termiticorpusculum sp.]MDR0459942.1 CDP-2,3-bis-(O-geranylgeranyl)-sn-glycerol synthase [Nitrososphaerota archaeon]